MSIAELYVLAKEMEENREAFSAIDWSEAETLVTAIRHLSQEDLARLPVAQDILAYAAANADWDSCEAGNWPALIIQALDAA